MENNIFKNESGEINFKPFNQDEVEITEMSNDAKEGQLTEIQELNYEKDILSKELSVLNNELQDLDLKVIDLYEKEDLNSRIQNDIQSIETKISDLDLMIKERISDIKIIDSETKRLIDSN